MAILDDVKTLQNIDVADISKDGILTIFKNRAITVVKNYLNNSAYDTTYIEETFADAIIELVYNAYTNKGKGNIQAETQGSRSTTYKTGIVAMSDDIKKLLPLPSIGMI